MPSGPERENWNTEKQRTNSTAKLGSAARGNIEPGPRIARGEISQETLQDLNQNLSRGNFNRDVDFSFFLPAKCVDGRPRADGQTRLRPNSAGGSFSLLVADMLTDQSLRKYRHRTARTTAEYARNVFDYFANNGYSDNLGGHIDDHAKGDNCGCGAADKMEAIIGYIAENPAVMFNTGRSLGVRMSENAHDDVFARTKKVSGGSGMRFSSGTELMAPLYERVGDEGVEILTGEHREVTLGVNHLIGTTLDRQAINDAYGDDYQAFNADIWTLTEAAKMFPNRDEDVIKEKFTAMLYYNIATSYVLGGESLGAVSVK